MSISSVLILLLLIGSIWTLLWAIVIRSVKYQEDEAAVSLGTATFRRRVTLPFIAIIVLGIALSIYWMPYAGTRSRMFGEPEMVVTVDAIQWAWLLSEDTVPVDTTIEFSVTSKDVNHNFAIYSPEGDLLTQVQAMPGHTNRLIYKFDRPGEYAIRCLEYCGISHHMMIRKLTVA